MTIHTGSFLSGEEGAIGRGLRWWGRTLISLMPRAFVTYLHDRIDCLVWDGKQFALNGQNLDGVVASALAATRRRFEIALDPAQGISFKTNLPVNEHGEIDLRTLHAEVSRQTPFSADQVVVGSVFAGSIQPDGRRAVVVAVVLKDVLEQMVSAVDNIGISTERVTYLTRDGLSIDLSSSPSSSQIISYWGPLAFVAGLLFLFSVPVINGNRTLDEARQIRDAQKSRLEALVAKSDGGAVTTRHLVENIVAERLRTPLISQLLARISDTLPEGVTLEFLKVNTEGLVIEGRTLDSSELLSNLEFADWIESVEFISPLTKQNDGQERFQLKLVLATPEQTEP